MTTKSAMGFVCLVALGLGAVACVAESASGDAETAGERDGAIKGALPADAYPEAVLIDMMKNGQVIGACSGALIGPRFVLTAAHCVRHPSMFRVTSPALGEVAMADLAAAYDAYDNGELVDPASHDVGLLRLATPIDLPSYPLLRDEPLANGKRVVNVGRIEDGEISFDSMFASRPVKVRGAADIGFPFAYRATEKIEPGDSGGPDFVAGSGPHVIAAVNSGSGHGIELLARVDLVHDWIMDWMGKHAAGSASGGGSTGDACAHDVCEAGKKLDPACGDGCTGLVCEGDAFCCESEWDQQCALEASLLCGACGG